MAVNLPIEPMTKKKIRHRFFFIFTLYVSICIYLLITDDLYFNFLIHSLNIFEITIDGFSFHLMFQLSLKFIIFYLIFKMLIAYKNRNKLT